MQRTLETGPEPLGPRRRRRIPWSLVLLDMMAVAWMTSAGSWFDDRALFEVITLGGHHELVAVLATVSFVILAGLAVSTQGFARASSAEMTLFMVAAVLTVVALAGLLSLVALIVGAGIFVGLLVKLFLR